MGAALRATWRAATARPVLTLVLAVALHTLPTVGARDLWFADEVRHGNVLQQLSRSGHWLVLYLNGAPYPDKPPLYFWLLGLLASLCRSDGPVVFFLAMALSTLALLLAIHRLARTVAGLEPGPALAAALLPLTVPYVVGAAHYTRPDMLFAALITASHLWLYRAWRSERPGIAAMVGFGLGGIATLVKGPLGLALPLVASMAYLAWRRRLRRLTRADAAGGLLLGLLLPLAWLAAAGALEGWGLVRTVLEREIWQRATASFMHARPVYYYLLVLPLVWLPWTLVPLVGGLAGWSARGERPGMRRDAEGLAYLRVLALSGLGVLSVPSIKIEIYLLPLVGPLAILTVLAMEALPAARLARLRIGMALVLAVLGLLVARPGWVVEWFGSLHGAMASGLLLAGVGLAVVVQRRADVPALLLTLVVGLGVWINAALGLMGPSLDAIMSPRAQAELMGAYARLGYVPVAHDTVPGLFAYHAGTTVRETRRFEDLDGLLAGHDRVVVAIRRRDWERWPARSPALRIVHHQRIADAESLLAVQAR